MPDIFNQAMLGSNQNDTKVDLADAQVKDLKATVEKARVVRKHKPPQTLSNGQIKPITSSKDLTQATQPLDVASAEKAASQPPIKPQSQSISHQPETLESESNQVRAEKTKHIDEYSEVMRQEKPLKSRFHSYVPKPLDVTFASQIPQEQIVLILRQHPITQLKNVLIVFGMIFGYFFLVWLGFFNFLPSSYHLGITLFWFLIIIGYSFATFLKWLYNMYIITDERIIDVDVYNLLKRNLTSAKIDHIQDVTAANYGLLGSIFDVGIVVVQTAGANPMLEFGGVPHPARVVTLINELMLEEEREKVEGRVM